jgi:hypothetical protein
MPERLMLRLLAFESPSLECTPVRASGPGSVKSMSALGHKRTFGNVRRESALPL